MNTGVLIAAALASVVGFTVGEIAFKEPEPIEVPCELPEIVDVLCTATYQGRTVYLDCVDKRGREFSITTPLGEQA